MCDRATDSESVVRIEPEGIDNTNQRLAPSTEKCEERMRLCLSIGEGMSFFELAIRRTPSGQVINSIQREARPQPIRGWHDASP